MLQTLAVANYRSLRDLVVPLGRLNVVTGANGSGKSSLYRALRLLAEVAQGGLIASIAREGGLPSTLWAGPETVSRAMKAGRVPVQGTVRTESVSLKFGFVSDEFGYAIDLGMPPPIPPSAFNRDPEIKREVIWAGPFFRKAAILVDRRGPSLRTRGAKGEWNALSHPMRPFASMMTEFADPHGAPEMVTIRESVRSWRFYDHFRTDAQAPARQPQIGTHTPVLAADGSDLPAALQTISEIGDHRGLDAAIDDAFPGASVEITETDGWFEIGMRQSGLLRPLKSAELSDGTLRYLLLVAALMTPRPPELMVLNEPETSLHPDLVPALGRLIAVAAERSQIIIVTHNDALIAGLGSVPGCHAIRLQKSLGETVIEGQGLLDKPAWHWPER